MICKMCGKEETGLCWDVGKGIFTLTQPCEIEIEGPGQVLIAVCSKCWEKFRNGSYVSFCNLLIFAFRQIAGLAFIPECGSGKGDADG